MEDRYQTARLGLCFAALKFDSSRGNTFAAYAQHWVRNSLQRFSDSDHPVYVPYHTAGKMKRIQMTATRLAARRGEDRALEYLHWVINRYNLWHAWSIISHDRSEPDSVEICRKVSFDDELLSKLTEREQLIIRFRFGINTEPRTLEYIAENMLGGISRERVRQIERDALRKLKVQYEG